MAGKQSTKRRMPLHGRRAFFCMCSGYSPSYSGSANACASLVSGCRNDSPDAKGDDGRAERALLGIERELLQKASGGSRRKLDR
ncbi:hypothetical protein [Treponema endosymbiont of Eucomonympha sp.]|uniref:hypothetical protein n=1 Tax=Treponema endosymbiont of Eucomonympha sp. TaxID=1580831 RepID=UPI001396B5A9|nr:hypothetical protein [Treponema endosymbiont of Eucomonympha sp.]